MNVRAAAATAVTTKLLLGLPIHLHLLLLLKVSPCLEYVVLLLLHSRYFCINS